MSNFAFLRGEFPLVAEEAYRAEQYLRVDPRVSMFYARRALETSLEWAFQADVALKKPYRDDLSAMIHEPSLRATAGHDVRAKMNIVRKKSNRAVHDRQAVSLRDAEVALGQLFHVMVWFHHTYTRQEPVTYAATLDLTVMPDPGAARRRTATEFDKLQADAKAKDAQLAKAAAQNENLDEEIKRLRREVAAAKTANRARGIDHDWDEATTRREYIDVDLEEAGWSFPEPGAGAAEGAQVSTEYPVRDLPGGKRGKVDYVLWGADGLPLAVVEAKRTRKDARAGQYQARQYADALEAAFGRRPLIYYSNGHEHWFWDDDERTAYPPRRVSGFRTADELELVIRRRAARKDLNTAPVDRKLLNRYYQERAVRSVDAAFQTDNQRGALLVMATGSGKTRTVVGLVDQLTKANWAKRVLFLADRKALVRQAVNAFKSHLPSSNPVNLLHDKVADARVYVSTYPTMLNLIGQQPDVFGPGFFDLIIVDEAHRSVYQKYRSIFEWFDAYRVGLTATPKDEVDRNTYELFGLEPGVPTDEYSLEQAIADEYLVNYLAVRIELAFPQTGIRYADLTEQEKDEWDALDWGDDDGDVPDEVDAEAVNRWLFNADTVDKVLATLMEQGLHVEGGDRIGKTIIFAKNDAHAKFIAERFDKSFPEHKGSFAAVITHSVERADQLLEDFSEPGKAPHIAISVDMLDTGVDVPDVVNLVFFKRVRSLTKFWQMIGRGTRLRKDLYGPGEDKDEFYIFDFCGNLEYFSQNPQGTEGRVGATLGERIFTSRVELLLALQAEDEPLAAIPAKDEGTKTLSGLRRDVADTLTAKVQGMNLRNFLVRPHRPLVEQYSEREAWGELVEQAAADVVGRLAKLPSAVRDGEESAKRFDLILLQLQLGTLKPEQYSPALRERVQDIASGLLESTGVREVAAQAALLQELTDDEWWEDATVPMLELVRRRIRGLVKFLPPHKRARVYTNFEDTLGDLDFVDMGRPSVGVSPERFKEKTLAFLREHENHTALLKVRRGRQLTPQDLDELGRMLVEAGVGTEDDIATAAEDAGGLGMFIRRLVGLEKSAVIAAFEDFLAAHEYNADQIRFVETVVAGLSQGGVVEPEMLYESPYTDHAPGGPDTIFEDGDVDRIVSIVNLVNDTARVDTASA
ncbi:DEAD/DEAH box helicase family protein [Myceligenerans indicum]|uniref:DEAD/DEAH box helicase family protein n=1 Tax=Myceligenerans indicum TaxID=2593663 RepID=A0ABS1LQ66_9MICO|nr:DEAD/DEAH box helicase family protein [Myceligenerans indicum]MBL0888144.1 DEAD/DEAH box helicase family protein [Myceligenerans indicum]